MANTKITSNVISDDINLGGNPTTTTQSAGNNTTRIATTAFVKAAIDATIDSAPGALDTLNELAAALGDDANFSTTITNSIATKLPLAGGTMTGDLTLSSGTSNKPKLTIINTNADSTPPYLILQKHSASPADNDEVGRIYMYGDDDAGNATEAFLAIGKMTDVSNGSEDSSLDLYTYAAGSQKSTLTLKEGQVAIGHTNPASPLHVKTTDQSIQIRNTGNANVGLEIYRDSDGAKGASIAWGNGNANLEIKNYRNDGQSGGPYANIDFFTGGTDADSPDFNPTRRMRIQQTGEVGIGTDDPTALLHLFKGESGAVANNTDSGLVLENSSHTYINFLTPASKEAGILWGDDADNNTGMITYSHLTDNMVITAADDIVLSADTVNVGNNKPVWSGSYGGALFLKGNNATADRYARICTVDSTGAAINNGLTVNNNGSTTIDCGETYSLNVSGNGAGLRFSTGSNQRIYWNTHRALEGAADGSQLQVGEGFTTMLVQSREKYIVDGATYGRVIIRFNATTTGDRLTAVTANLNTLLGLSTSDYGQWTVEFGGYAGSGTNGCTGSFTIGGYTGHNYSATNYNSYGAGTINVGYSSSGGAQTGAGPLSYHPVQNNGIYIASGEIWVYVPAAQQVGIMIKNNGSQNLAGTMTVTATVRG